jgi:hypothetical protein
MIPDSIVRRRARSVRGALACAGGVLFALATTVSAQPQPTPAPAAQPPEDPNVVAAARALAVEGVKLARDSRCDEAVDKLERAEQLRHSLIVLAELGGCYIVQGRFVQGAEAMRSVLREGLPENPSEAMKAAHENARTQLETAKTKIAMLTIAVDAGSGVEPAVTIDGQPIPPALIGAPRPTDPGEHTIEATAPGYLRAKRRVTLDAGETDQVTLALMIDPISGRSSATTDRTGAPAAAARSAPEVAAASQPSAAVSSSSDRLPAYLTWGAGAAALAVGATFGWVAMDQKSDLDRVCPGKRCPPEQSARLDAAKANGVISSVAFGVGVAAAVFGGVLFLVANDDEAEATPTAAAAIRLEGAGVAVVF